MAFLLDHIAATLVIGSLVLVLATLQFRAQHASVEQTAMYTAKKQTLEFADFLTRELSNIGMEMPEDQRLEKHSSNAYGLTDTLRFWRKDLAGDVLKIEYVLVPADTIVYHDTTAVLYEMRRYQNDVLSGRSMPTLRSFNIDLFDDSGVAVSDSLLGQARQMRIRITTALPYGDPSRFYLPEIHWGTTLRPQGLE